MLYWVYVFVNLTLKESVPHQPRTSPHVTGWHPAPGTSDLSPKLTRSRGKSPPLARPHMATMSNTNVDNTRHINTHGKTHIHTHSLSLSLSLSHTHTHTLSVFDTHTHTHTLCHTYTLSLSHTHIHTHSLSLSHSHTLSLSHTHTHTISTE